MESYRIQKTVAFAWRECSNNCVATIWKRKISTEKQARQLK